MKTRMTIIGASLVGSLLIYCGQQTVKSTLDGAGPVGDARASGGASCCVPVFGKVSAGRLEKTPDFKKAYTELLDVSAYRQLVLYVKTGTAAKCHSLRLVFAPDSASPEFDFGSSSGQGIDAGVPHPVLGRVVRLSLPYGSGSECDEVDYHLLGIN
jgi:hypothetical protein